MAGSWHSCLQEEEVHFLLSLPANLITACSAGKSRAIPPSAGKTEKNTGYGSNHPPEALLSGLKHLGLAQVQETDRRTQF